MQAARSIQRREALHLTTHADGLVRLLFPHAHSQGRHWSLMLVDYRCRGRGSARESRSIHVCGSWEDIDSPRGRQRFGRLNARHDDIPFRRAGLRIRRLRDAICFLTSLFALLLEQTVVGRVHGGTAAGRGFWLRRSGLAIS